MTDGRRASNDDGSMKKVSGSCSHGKKRKKFCRLPLNELHYGHLTTSLTRLRASDGKKMFRAWNIGIKVSFSPLLFRALDLECLNVRCDMNEKSGTRRFKRILREKKRSEKGSECVLKDLWEWQYFAAKAFFSRKATFSTRRRSKKRSFCLQKSLHRALFFFVVVWVIVEFFFQIPFPDVDGGDFFGTEIWKFFLPSRPRLVRFSPLTQLVHVVCHWIFMKFLFLPPYTQPRVYFIGESRRKPRYRTWFVRVFFVSGRRAKSSGSSTFARSFVRSSL